SIYDHIRQIIDEVGINIEMHTHNDFGLATANTLAGIRAGAKYAGVTINGLGERAGNAALEEVVMALKYVYKNDLGIKTHLLKEVCEYVSKASGRVLPLSKTIVGLNVFAHESGIHTDGILKDSKTYESFSPEEVGLQRQILIGKHSGRNAIIAKFKEYDIDLTPEEAEEILKRVRSLSVQLKRSLFDKELIYLYSEMREEKIKDVNLQNNI
ncbi:MAG: homoaconitate hydratase, partial [Thermotogota bacterium]|nr:homoaconitate hydratase [Thermotogota bacterium]